MMWVRRMGVGCIWVVIGVVMRRRRWRELAVRIDHNGSVRVMPRTIWVVDGSVGVVDGSVWVARWRGERVVVVVLGIGVGEWEGRHGTGCRDEVQGEGTDALK